MAYLPPSPSASLKTTLKAIFPPDGVIDNQIKITLDCRHIIFSHHHELGRMLARGETDGIAGEGIHTLVMVRQHQLFDTANYPLFRLIDSIVKQPGEVRRSIAEYLDENR